MSELLQRRCSNNPELAPRLSEARCRELLSRLDSDWKLDLTLMIISRNYAFKNYYQTMAFANSVAWIAHQQDHHPDMLISYRHCAVHYSTHSVKGLSINDFICAAQVDALVKQS
jgi:4a-hydroxytetrahydrobiopterin dehydratase